MIIFPRVPRAPRGSILRRAVSSVLVLPICLLLTSAPLRAGAKTVRFTIETRAETRTGRLVSCEDSSAAVDGGAAARFLELRQDGKTLPPLLTRDVLVLTTGDRIALDPAAGATL